MPNTSKRKKPVPLTRQPVGMKSRKRARQVTTQFHTLTHQRAHAVLEGDTAKIGKIDEKLQAMGGRSEYQRASQLSTSFHSTSKWVLGHLSRLGWLYGIKLEGEVSTEKQERAFRRHTLILEVGAINTELLDAAADSTASGDAKHRIDVRAIDLHAMDDRIEEADFLSLPFVNSSVSQRYDVIVCSMVINCVPTPAERGKMLFRLFEHLRPGGLLFLTLPKYCLTKSAFVTMDIFEQMLGGGGGVGFDIQETKQSPKVAFFICRRPEQDDGKRKPLNKLWAKQVVRNKGKKFPNQFSVTLDAEELLGQSMDGGQNS